MVINLITTPVDRVLVTTVIHYDIISCWAIWKFTFWKIVHHRLTTIVIILLGPSFGCREILSVAFYETHVFEEGEYRRVILVTSNECSEIYVPLLSRKLASWKRETIYKDKLVQTVRLLR